ncbi:hypothetical protein EJB05_50709, partial [Eragrostis curvula]
PQPQRNEQAATCAACVSEHSHCDMDYSGSGYRCKCNELYQGNPYIVDGCSADTGYSPILHGEKKCPRTIGTIPTEFPSGLEERCYARKEFRRNYTNVVNDDLAYNVTHIDINKVQMGINRTSRMDDGGMLHSRSLYSGSSSNHDVFNWANLTCQHSRYNSSGYDCNNSTLSECVRFNLTEGGYIGYRCQCKYGFHGNPYRPNGCKGLIVGFCVCFGIVLGGLSATVVIRRWRKDTKKKLRRRYFQKNQGCLLEQLISSDENGSNNTKIFSFEELEKATDGFDSTRILGRGGYGVVYKGILSDQRVVAIKKPNTIEQSKINQFINEVAILSQINHRNIVQLLGCCLENEVPLLVYDFIPNGSLSQALHSSANSDFHLSWDHCLRIAIEAAGALCYLHSAASMPVFHRDVKSSNILLDANYTAKVSDFGISRLVTIEQTHVSTSIQGTFGYLDPEYFHTGQLNEKSDVYSFGVVLLELLLKREHVFTSESGSKQSLSRYFIEEFNTRPITEIASPRVCEEAAEEEINSIASLAERCLRPRGEERPTMKEVDMALQTIQKERLKSYRPAAKYDKLPYSKDKDITHQSEVYSLELEFLSSVKLQ